MLGSCLTEVLKWFLEVYLLTYLVRIKIFGEMDSPMSNTNHVEIACSRL